MPVPTTPNLGYFTIAQTLMAVPNALDMPGVGKSEIGAAFARALGRKFYAFYGSIREPADIGGYPYPDKTESGRSVMRILPPEILDVMWEGHEKGDYFVLMAEELTGCAPAVQAALMRLPAERKLGDHDLPPSTIVIAASNPPEIATNGFELAPPMANRLCHLPWADHWDGFDEGLTNRLQFPDPKFVKLPDDWKNHLDSVGVMVKAFRRHRPTLFKDFPKERSKQCAAWPSPRSWRNGVVGLAACKAIDAEPAVGYQVLEGCIGHGASHEFRKWEEALDLPEPEGLIKKAIAASKNGHDFAFDFPRRVDRLMATLGSVAERVVNHNNTTERWEAAARVFAVPADDFPEIVVTSFKPLAPPNVPSKVVVPKIFRKKVIPLLKKVGLLEGL